MSNINTFITSVGTEMREEFQKLGKKWEVSIEGEEGPWTSN